MCSKEWDLIAVYGYPLGSSKTQCTFGSFAILFLNGPTLTFFHFFIFSMSSTVINSVASGIQTWIARVEGKGADHYTTTTTAQLLFNTLLQAPSWQQYLSKIIFLIISNGLRSCSVITIMFNKNRMD